MPARRSGPASTSVNAVAPIEAGANSSSSVTVTSVRLPYSAKVSRAGNVAITDLAPQFRQVAETLQPNQISEPIRTSAGLHLVAVCGKRASGGEELSHDQIENRLYGQQLSMISRRYMRDLRNSATIETR